MYVSSCLDFNVNMEQLTRTLVEHSRYSFDYVVRLFDGNLFPRRDGIPGRYCEERVHESILAEKT